MYTTPLNNIKEGDIMVLVDIMILLNMS